MATIDYKQKIKDYMNSSEVDTLYKSMLNNLFPELKESDGEMVWLSKFIQEEIDCLCFDIRDDEDRKKLENLRRSLSWLEKQGEQKTAGWSEEDEAIYYGVIETEQYMLDVVNGMKKFAVGNISIKEECTRELNWLKSLKDRVQPQQRQEWSDVDKGILFRTIDDLEFLRDAISLDPKYAVNIIDIEREINWLKSLKPQTTWKPSDEQMHYLSWIANVKLGDSVVEQEVSKHLNELLEELKKLK